MSGELLAGAAQHSPEPPLDLPLVRFGARVIPATLSAGAARRVINPPLGTRRTGFRLFGNPVQAIESDLTASRSQGLTSWVE